MSTQRKRLMPGAALAGILALALAGCGGAAGDTEKGNLQTKTAEEYVQAAQDALEQAEGFEASFTAEISMDGTVDMKTGADVVVRREPLQARVDIRHDFAGTGQGSSIYLEENADAVNLYMDYEQQWTEMTLSREDAMDNIQIYNAADNMVSLLAAAEGWQVGEAEQDIVSVEAEIPAAKVYAVEEDARFFQLAGMSGLSETYFQNVGDVAVTFRFNWKTGQPISYQMDFADALETVTNNVLKELNGGTLENGVTVGRYMVSAEISKLGDVETVEIPAAAKSDAINFEKEIRLLEDNAG